MIMRISDVVKQLQILQEQHGDLEVRVLDSDSNLDVCLNQVELNQKDRSYPFVLIW